MAYKLLAFIFVLSACSVIESGNFYKISSFDDPISIAHRFNISLCSLRESNKTRRFKLGEYIFIPLGRGIFGQVDDCGPTENFLAQGGYLWPLKGRKKVSSRFGKRWNRHHNGIDIPSPLGTPIRAAQDGKVYYSGYQFGGYGNLTIITHMDGSMTYYAHAKKNYLRKGKWVKKGTRIAEVGKTGNATGPHLHFEIRKMGIPVNPLEFYSLNI